MVQSLTQDRATEHLREEKKFSRSTTNEHEDSLVKFDFSHNEKYDIEFYDDQFL